MPLTRRFSMVSINCFIERANRSSFQTISVSPVRESEGVMQSRTVCNRTRHLLGENLLAPCFG